jgi:hypothetical protein
VLAVESSELAGDVGFGDSTEEMGDDGPDSVTVSGVVITVVALSFHQWYVSFCPLAESMFRRMEGVKGDVRAGHRGHGWLLIGSMDSASNRLEAVMKLMEEGYLAQAFYEPRAHVRSSDGR